ncbi:MAG: hypothetical protein WCE27_01290, partial [Pseudolabrys sp.]
LSGVKRTWLFASQCLLLAKADIREKLQMDYGPIAHHGTCLDNQFSTSESNHDESKTFRKGAISQERWGEDDGSAPQALARLVHLATGHLALSLTLDFAIRS